MQQPSPASSYINFDQKLLFTRDELWKKIPPIRVLGFKYRCSRNTSTKTWIHHRGSNSTLLELLLRKKVLLLMSWLTLIASFITWIQWTYCLVCLWVPPLSAFTKVPLTLDWPLVAIEERGNNYKKIWL